MLFTKNVIVIDHSGVNQRTYCDHCDAKNLLLQENIVEKIWIENIPVFLFLFHSTYGKHEIESEHGIFCKT